MKAEPTRAARVIAVLWPAFVMAGLLEALVFVVVDPATLSAQGGQWPELSRQAVYSLTFFVFWAVIAAACGLTAWLLRIGSDVT